MPADTCSSISLGHVARSAWVPALVFSLISFVIALSAVIYVVYRTNRNQKYMAAYQADTMFIKVGVAQDEAASLMKDINSRWNGDLQDGDSLADCPFKKDGDSTDTAEKLFNPEYPFNYALFFLLANGRSVEDKRMNVLRRQVNSFWQGVETLFKGGQLPGTFFTWRSSVWPSRGKNYRHIMEPIDIANFYRYELDKDSGPYSAGNNRPSQYQILEKAMPRSEENHLDDKAREELTARLMAARQFQQGHGNKPPTLSSASTET